MQLGLRDNGSGAPSQLAASSRHGGAGAVWLLAAILTLAYILAGIGAVHHLLIGPEQPDQVPTLGLRWSGIAGNVWAAASLLLLHIGIGWLLAAGLPSLRGLPRHSIVGLCFLLVIGTFVSHAAMVGLAALKLLSPLTGSICLAVSAVAGAAGLWGLLASWPRNASGGRQHRRGFLPWWATGLLVLLLLAWGVPLAIQSLLPNSDWDGASTHLPMARLLITQEFWSVDVGNWWLALPGAAQLFFGQLWLLGFPQAAIPFNVLWTALTVAAVYPMAREIGGRKAAILATGICLTQNLIWEVAITPRTDTFITFYFVIGLYAILLWLRDTSRRGHVLLCAMCLGMLAGMKYTAVVFGAFVGLALLVELVIHPRRVLSLGLRTIFASMLLVLLPSSLWYVRNAVVVGDPVYPMLAGIQAVDAQGRLVSLGRALSRFEERETPDAAQHAPLSSGKPAPPKRAQHAMDSGELAVAMPSGTAVDDSDGPPDAWQFWDVTTTPSWHGRKPLNSVNMLLLPALLLPLVRRDRLTLVAYLLTLGALGAMGCQSFLTRYVLPVVPVAAVGAGVVLCYRRGVLLAALGLPALVVWRAKEIAGKSEMVGWLGPWVGLDPIEAAALLTAAGAVLLLGTAGIAAIARARRGKGTLNLLPRCAPVAAGCVVALFLAGNGLMESVKLATMMYPREYLGGTHSHLQWLSHAGYNGVPSMPQFLRFAAEAVRDGRLRRDRAMLMVGESKANLLPLPYLPDSSREGHRWSMELVRADGDLSRVAQNLRREGVGYILVNLEYLQWASWQPGMARDQLALNLSTLSQFIEEYAQHDPPLYRTASLLLVELKPPAGGTMPGTASETGTGATRPADPAD